MKLLLKTTLLLIFVAATMLKITLLAEPLLAVQDDRLDDFTFENEQIEEPKQPYFAISAGATGSWLFMNYDEINKKILNSDIGEALTLGSFESPMFMLGFNIFLALSPFVNNARIGFSYQTGSKTFENSLDSIPSINLESGEKFYVDFNYTHRLSVQMTGLHLDYAVVPTKSLALLPGVGIKWGTMTFEKFRTILPYKWNSAYKFVNGEYNEQMRYSFMTIEPKLDIEYALTGFLMFRASAGYMLTFNNPFSKYAWTINGDNELANVPNSIKPQGLTLQMGLFLGLLNY